MGEIDSIEEFLVFHISHSVAQVSNTESESLENLAHRSKWAANGVAARGYVNMKRCTYSEQSDFELDGLQRAMKR